MQTPSHLRWNLSCHCWLLISCSLSCAKIALRNVWVITVAQILLDQLCLVTSNHSGIWHLRCVIRLQPATVHMEISQSFGILRRKFPACWIDEKISSKLLDKVSKCFMIFMTFWVAPFIATLEYCLKSGRCFLHWQLCGWAMPLCDVCTNGPNLTGKQFYLKILLFRSSPQQT